MKKASVIGIGNAGKYVINKIVEENGKTNTIYLSYDEEDKEGCKADIIANVSEGIEPLKQINFKNNIFIISHLGDVKRDRINRELKSIIEHENNNICEICLFPFTFEGRKRLNSSIETLKSIDEKNIIIDGDLLLKDIDRKTTIKELFNIAYDILYNNYKDYSKSNIIQSKKYIVDFKEKEKEINETEIWLKKLDNELDIYCCMGYRRNRKNKKMYNK